MEWVAVGFVAVLVVLGLVIAYRRGRLEVWDLDAAPARLQLVERHRERALRAMKDLDFEYQAGTIAEGDYQRIRNSYKLQAVRLTQERDRLARHQVEVLSQGGNGGREDREALEEIEADVEELKRQAR